LVVCYTGNAHNVLRFVCVRGAHDNGEPRCISFGGLLVDDAMTKEILRVVQPAAVDGAVIASEAAARRDAPATEVPGQPPNLGRVERLNAVVCSVF
jgi:hypothetical protein